MEKIINNFNNMRFNPTFKDFLKEYEDTTLIGLGWAIYWRMVGVLFVIIGLIEFIDSL